MEAAGEEMNYDDVLEFIQKDINDAAFKRNEYYPSRSLLALKAIVELHKPIETTPPWFGDKYLACNHCEEWTNDGAYQSKFPCKTIQAVTLELS
jgi:hypothetical protein